MQESPEGSDCLTNIAILALLFILALAIVGDTLVEIFGKGG